MALFPALGALPEGLRKERVLASPRFRDGRFRNTDPKVGPDLKSGEKWSTIRDFAFGPSRRPPVRLPVERPHAAWSTPSETGLRITWLGHSTLLLEIDGVRVLTDPVLGERSSPVSFAGPRRFHDAPSTVADLPRLDAVLVSHDHFDHLDYGTVRELAARDVPFVTSLGVGAHLESWGVPATNIHELDWWEGLTLPEADLRFTATPAAHFSGRSPGTRSTSLWSSWVLGGPHHKVFFSGDTGLTEEFVEIGKRFGPFDVTLLEIGAFHPAWGSIHLGPDNALVAHRMLGSGALLPVHWSTFDLGLHPWEEPAETLYAAHGKHDVRLITPRLGRPVELSRVEGPDPWWRNVRG